MKKPKTDLKLNKKQVKQLSAPETVKVGGGISCPMSCAPSPHGGWSNKPKNNEGE